MSSSASSSCRSAGRSAPLLRAPEGATGPIAARAQLAGARSGTGWRWCFSPAVARLGGRGAARLRTDAALFGGHRRRGVRAALRRSRVLGSLDRAMLRASPDDGTRIPASRHAWRSITRVLASIARALIFSSRSCAAAAALGSWHASTGWRQPRLAGASCPACSTLALTLLLAVAMWEAVQRRGRARISPGCRARQQAARSARLRTLLPLLRTTPADHHRDRRRHDGAVRDRREHRLRCWPAPASSAWRSASARRSWCRT